MTIRQNFPGIMPSLNLNFAKSKRLDQRVTFQRLTGATVTNELGLIERVGNNIPRFDHSYDSTGAIRSLGLLIEEQRENLATYSNTLSSWGSAYSQTIAQDAVGPDGIANSAWTIDDTYAGGDGAFREKSIAVTPSTDQYCFSVFAKQGTAIWFDLYGFFIGSSTQAAYLNYNWSTDTITVGSAENSPPTPTTYGKIAYPNGWYRFYFVFSDPLGTNNTLLMRLYVSSRNAGYTGTTLFYGAQVEKGAFPTSYIPTQGLPVTRAEDSVYIDGRIGDNFSWYNPLEGSILWTGNVYGTEKQAVCPYKISNLSNLRGIGPQFDTRSLNNTAVFMARAVSSNIPVKNAPFGTIPSSDTIKIAGAYEEGVGISAAFDGSPPASSGGDSQTDIVSGNEYYLDIGGSRSLSGSNNKFTGVCEQLIYYPRRVTDLQLQSISK